MTEEINDSKLVTQLKLNAGNILSVVALSVAGFFAFQHWSENRTAKVDLLASDKFIELENKSLAINAESQKLLAENATDDTKDKKDRLYKHMLTMVNDHNDSIYTWQTLMLKAKNESDDGNYSAALISLESALNTEIEDEGLLAITKLRYAQALMATEGADKALAYMSSEELPASFEVSKQELIGDLKISKDDKDGAIEAYTKAWSVIQDRKEEREESRRLLAMKMENLGLDTNIDKVVKTNVDK